MHFHKKKKVNEIDKLYDKKFENLDLDVTIDFLNNIITKANETKCEVTFSRIFSNPWRINYIEFKWSFNC